MTPRTIDTVEINKTFSELLLQQTKDVRDDFDFRSNAESIRLLHPKIMLAMINYMNNPEQEAESFLLADMDLHYFPSVEVVKKHHDAPVILGTPYEIGKLLKTWPDEIILDCSFLGSVLISQFSRTLPATTGIHNQLLPIWMNYATSPELWGPQGKWPRFHQRLHTLFKKYHLLMGEEGAGFYRLKFSGRNWDKIGIKGDRVDDQLCITLPWSFSLSALEKLERQIVEET